MSFKNTNKLLAEYVTQVVTETGFQLVDFEFVKEGSNWVFRIFIDKDGGITIDDCETFSRRLEKILDEKDPIPQEYMLEVSSPGVDRPLKKAEDFVKYKGEMVSVKLYRPINNKKEYYGTLVGWFDEVLVITDEDGNELSFQKSDVALCKLNFFGVPHNA